ncbi:hypothetical protein KY345_06970 [Candidatus Woesearchaeota archaeon]|nr:hypothetical protein [Candidatus Woesearchaeota archaeon]
MNLKKKIMDFWSEKPKLHILLSLSLIVLGAVGGGLGSIYIYDYLYYVGKVNILTLLGVLFLVSSFLLFDIFFKSTEKRS